MRAFGLLMAMLVASDSTTRLDRPPEPSDPVLPLDEATLRAWRAWAGRQPDAGSARPAVRRWDRVSAGVRRGTPTGPSLRPD